MPNKTIKIEWQRLVIDKETCPRCGGTEQEMERAAGELKARGFKVEVLKKELSEEEFKQKPLASNKIIINGKLLEEWLAAGTGSSCCCAACGDADCRTLEYDSKVYETIPAELIISAALIAAK